MYRAEQTRSIVVPERVRLDDERRALLLEQLGPSMHKSKVEAKQAISLLCKTLKQAWLIPPGGDQTLHAWEYKAQTLAQLIRELWDTLERPCSDRLEAGEMDNLYGDYVRS